MGRVAGCGWALTAILATGSAHACNGDPFLLNWGSALDVRMRVKASENCRFGLKIGGANHLEAVVVSQAPQHGTLTQSDRSHFFYHPSNGYTGPYVLRITATGDMMGNRHIYSGDLALTYHVQVVP